MPHEIEVPLEHVQEQIAKAHEEHHAEDEGGAEGGAEGGKDAENYWARFIAVVTAHRDPDWVVRAAQAGASAVAASRCGTGWSSCWR